MITKSKTQKTGKEKKGRIKVGTSQLNKETAKDLTKSAAQKVRGGGFLDDAIGFAKKVTPAVVKK